MTIIIRDYYIRIPNAKARTTRATNSQQTRTANATDIKQHNWFIAIAKRQYITILRYEIFTVKLMNANKYCGQNKRNRIKKKTNFILLESRGCFLKKNIMSFF